MNGISLGLLYASVFSPIIPILIYFRAWKSLKQRAFVYLLLAIIVAFVSDAGSLALIDADRSSIPLINAHWLVTFVLLAFYVKNILTEKSKIIFGLLATVMVVFLLNGIYGPGIEHYQGYSVAAGGIMMVTLAVIYYSSLLETLPTPDLSRYGFFWINSAIAFYFSFNLMLFVFSNYVFTNLSTDVGVVFWSFHNINNVVKNALLALGIYCAGRNPAQ